jgi:hypothetical protein
LLLMAAASCGDARLATSSATRYAAPATQDQAEVCSDLGALRVCWADTSARSVTRALPAIAAPLQGWRCGGAGAARTCEARSGNAGLFECGTQRCLQARPRMPDDGEWECVEISGVVFCRSRGRAAGMDEGPADLGWLCGARRAGAEGERICVDLDPERPLAPNAARRHCRYELAWGTQVRSCTAGSSLIAGSPCRDASACPHDTQCNAGVCLPARPAPACWLDRDCGEGARCAFGSCVGS